MSTCVNCRKAFEPGDRKIQADSLWYHKECFTCDLCELPLVLGTYAEIEGKRVCQSCRNKEHCQKCSYIIASNSAMEVDGKLWHPECFTCTICAIPLKKFYEKDNKLFCNNCIPQAAGHKCARCSKPLGDVYTKAIGKVWHEECFLCQSCGKGIGETFVQREGFPYCDDCEKRLSASSRSSATKATAAKSPAAHNNKGGDGGANRQTSHGANSGGRGSDESTRSRSDSGEANRARSNSGGAPKGATSSKTKYNNPLEKRITTGAYEKTKNQEGAWNDLDDNPFD